MLHVRLTIGAELLNRIPINKWDEKLSKDLLNVIESHIHEPFTLVYTLVPLLTIVLFTEFLDNYEKRSNVYKNRCKVLKCQMVNIGSCFIKEMKSEE